MLGWAWNEVVGVHLEERMFRNAIFLHNFKQSISFNARVAVIVQTPYQSKEFCDLHQLIPMGKFFVSINYAYYEIQLTEEEAEMWNGMKLGYHYFPVTIDISYFIVCSSLTILLKAWACMNQMNTQQGSSINDKSSLSIRWLYLSWNKSQETAWHGS